MSDCQICGGCICHQMKGEGIKEDIKEDIKGEIKKIVKKGKPILKKGKEKIMEKVMEKVMETKMEGKGVKAPSKWISHVKSVAKEKGISYKDAMKQASATYNK